MTDPDKVFVLPTGTNEPIHWPTYLIQMCPTIQNVLADSDDVSSEIPIPFGVMVVSMVRDILQSVHESPNQGDISRTLSNVRQFRKATETFPPSQDQVFPDPLYVPVLPNWLEKQLRTCHQDLMDHGDTLSSLLQCAEFLECEDLSIIVSIVLGQILAELADNNAPIDEIVGRFRHLLQIEGDLSRTEYQEAKREVEWCFRYDSLQNQ